MEVIVGLLSGLVAAIVTAVFSYLVRVKVADRNSAKEKQKKCLSHLVRINEIVALEIVLKSYFELYMKVVGLKDHFDEMKEKCKKQGGQFNTEHIICAAAIILIEENKDRENSEADQKQISDIEIRPLVEMIGEFKIEQDLLIDLPPMAIYHYNSLVQNIIGLKYVFETWGDMLKKNSFENITLKELYDHWATFKNLSDNSKKVREALIEEGKIPKKFAEEILSKKIEELNGKLLEQIHAQVHLNQVKEFLMNSEEDNKTEAITQPS
jgi:hypothetical protein